MAFSTRRYGTGDPGVCAFKIQERVVIPFTYYYRPRVPRMDIPRDRMRDPLSITTQSRYLTHRNGRTARVQAKGTAYILLAER